MPNPVLVRLGPISIYWYGVLIVLGALLATYLASYLSRRNGHDPETAWNMLVVLLIAGVLGGRAYHVISSWDYYRVNPGEILGLQMSGFGIFGSVIGGLIALAIYCAVKKLKFLEWTDYIIPGVLLAQAIGRWGNFFNQELYGYPTTLPWGIYISPEHRLAGFEAYERFHPTFFYESALNFIGFIILFLLARNWKKNRLWGDIFFLYGMIYPLIRFFIEFQRPDAWMSGIPSLTMAQVVSIVGFAASAVLLVVRHSLHKPAMAYVQRAPWEPPVEATPMGQESAGEKTGYELTEGNESAAKEEPEPEATEESTQDTATQPPNPTE